MRISLAISLFLAATACANPIVIGPSAGANRYLDSEKLAVSISPTVATFTATFTFEGQGAFKPDPVLVKLPIWFPVESGADAAVKNFWSVFRPGECNDLSTNATARQVFDQAIGLNIRVGSRQLDLASDIGRFAALESYESTHEPGFCCLWVTFSTGADFVWKRTPVTISYRQPLLRTNAESRFFYLPIFENLPREVSTSDPDRYSITVTAEGCALALNTGGKTITIEDGKSVTLAPHAGQPIRAKSLLTAAQEKSSTGV